MTDPLDKARRFVAELKRRRVIRVAVVYVVAAFVVLQAADILFPALRLPEWTLSFLAALAILGFPVAVALAWAFDLTTEGVVKTPGREGRDDGALEGGDDSPAARVLVPRRAVWFVLGILVALSGAWFGATRLADETADVTVDEEAAPGLAVLPFRTTGEGLETWGEGMVDLLSRNLDGVGGLRAIDSRTILARFGGSRWGATRRTSPQPWRSLAGLVRAGRCWGRPWR